MNISFNSVAGAFLPQLTVLWFFISGAITVVVHVCFALAILADSQGLVNRLRRPTFLVGGSIWALATLLGGVFVAAIYWLIHHSNLRPQLLPAAPSQTTPL